MKRKYFIIKRSWLEVRKLWSGFQMVRPFEKPDFFVRFLMFLSGFVQFLNGKKQNGGQK
jgi:hypothetical protein